MMKKLLACVLCVLLLGSTALSFAEGNTDDTAGRVQTLLDGIIAYQLEKAGAENVQEWIDGELTRNAGQGAEWMVFALSQNGSYDLSAYRTALLKYLEGTGVVSASIRQKYALALLISGGSDAYVDKTMQETLGAQGIMSWVYGLHLLTSGCTGSVTAQQAVDELLALQLADGGWALRGEMGDPDVTAMTIQALAPYAGQEDVKEALERALALLSLRQHETGDYNTFGAVNPESAAQVLIAASALGINALEDERFIKNGYTLLDAMERFRLEDGSFCHAAGGQTNVNATVQVLQSLIAWQRMMDGRGSLYHITYSEAQPAMKTALDGHAIAALVIGGAAAVICVVLTLLGKRHLKNYAAVLVIAGALIAFVMTTEFKTADGYYTGAAVVKEDPIGHVTMSIRCDNAIGKTHLELPADGVMLAPTDFAIVQGDTAFVILTEAAQAYGIRLDSSGGQGMKYVAGINQLYEYACGDLSGWVYLVNGESASVGCDQHVLADGDVIEWHYTCELGNDL